MARLALPWSRHRAAHPAHAIRSEITNLCISGVVFETLRITYRKLAIPYEFYLALDGNVKQLFGIRPKRQDVSGTEGTERQSDAGRALKDSYPHT